MKQNTVISSYFKCTFLALSILLASCKRNFNTLKEQPNTYALSTEQDLRNSTYSKKIDSFYEGGKSGFFNGADNVPIYYKIFEQANTEKAIVIASGRTEAAIKYKELIFDLYKNGYSIYIHDHRGQGLSGRMTEDLQMGYIDSFQFYVDDMKLFYNQYVKHNNYSKIYLLAHSMGGAIGMTYLEQFPNDFDAAAFSSPMLGLMPPICGIVKILNTDKPKYAIGESAYKDDKTLFEGNTLTTSEIRYDRMVDAFAKVPQAALGGATYQWVYKSCQQFKYLFSNIEKIKTPFIIFSAEHEKIVYPYAHQEFITEAKKLGKNCLAYEIENANHELFIEKDEPRIETINETLNFYSKY
ncbi:alpha/beta fold hydrolase [Algibacter mikhailovii]|uniref:Lysophospholipase L2 n=1 Tax=Algibacter mikhailovii TaxID=425498 RepID=A0A918R2T6_9FLAO|nr:alpha/beta fold hydrolase [Algibacter mikhailovii]GGZ80617.1 lysophospholipase L2 [Algibacter mikhailovii]